MSARVNASAVRVGCLLYVLLCAQACSCRSDAEEAERALQAAEGSWEDPRNRLTKLERAAELNPTAATFQALAQQAIDMGDGDVALAHADRAIALSDDAAGHVMRAEAMAAMGDLEGATAEYALAADKPGGHDYSCRVMHHELNGNEDPEARMTVINVCKAALREDPDHPYDQLLLGRVLLEIRGQLRGARGALEAAQRGAAQEEEATALLDVVAEREAIIAENPLHPDHRADPMVEPPDDGPADGIPPESIRVDRDVPQPERIEVEPSRIQLGDTYVDGGEVDVARAVISRDLRRLQRCAASDAQDVSVAVSLRGNGTTNRVSVQSSDPAITQCLTTIAERWRFPAGIISVTQPLIVAPE